MPRKDDAIAPNNAVTATRKRDFQVETFPPRLRQNTNTCVWELPEGNKSDEAEVALASSEESNDVMAQLIGYYSGRCRLKQVMSVDEKAILKNRPLAQMANGEFESLGHGNNENATLKWMHGTVGQKEMKILPEVPESGDSRGRMAIVDRTTETNPAVQHDTGDIVLIKGETLPRCNWRLGRVTETECGWHGFVSAVNRLRNSADLFAK